jgi:predicted permease
VLHLLLFFYCHDSARQPLHIRTTHSPSATFPPAGLRPLVAVSCAFGNSFTLPAVFFFTLLPAPLADRALGYAALFLLAWSPAMWSVGLALVGGGGPMGKKKEGVVAAAAAEVAGDLLQRGGGDGASKGSILAGRLREFVGNALSPPTAAILAGVVVGLTPLAAVLFPHTAEAAVSIAAAAAPHVADLPLELGLLRSVAHAAVAVIELLASATLAMQTVVLAASLLQRNEAGDDGGTSTSSSTINSSKGGGMAALRSALRTLIPASAAEGRALAVIAAARFLIVPAATVLALHVAISVDPGGLLASNPLLTFVLAVEAVMPSAQNLIILLQLRESTRSSAPGFAKMLLRLYAYAVIPVTLWVTGLATWLNIPILR